MNFKKLEAMFETANNGDVSLLKKYLSENFFWRSITQSSLTKNKRDKSETIAWFEEQPRSNIGKITCHFENDKIIVYQHSVPDHVEPQDRGDRRRELLSARAPPQPRPVARARAAHARRGDHAAWARVGRVERAGGRGGRHARREAAAAGGALELGDLGLEHGDGRVRRAAVAVALGHVRVDRLLHEGRRLVDRRQDAARRGVWSHSRMHESRVLRKSTGRQATLMVVPGTT